MAHVITNSANTNFLDEAGSLFAAPVKSLRDWLLYRRTLGELNELSDRELRDLGLSRSAIRQIAYDSVYN